VVGLKFILSTKIVMMNLAHMCGNSGWPWSARCTGRTEPSGRGVLPLLAHHSLNCLSIATKSGVLDGGASAKALLTSEL